MIYLDHHAATPLIPSARGAMERAAASSWANASSAHAFGRAARRLLEDARASVAASIGADPACVVFTSSGTEACHIAIRGMQGVRRIVTSPIEHPAVAENVSTLGVERVSFAMPRGVPPSAHALDLREGDLLAVTWVNHETGTILPVEAYVAEARAKGALTFVDGVQALGKLPVDVEALGADAVAFAAQKIGGPTGAAALYVRRGAPHLSPLVGGPQERGRRPGTPDVGRCVGFGAAADALPERLAAQDSIAALRDELEAGLASLGAIVNGVECERVATVVDVSFRGRRGPVLVAALDLAGVACSHGAACSSGLDEPSKVLLGLYPDDPERAASALRFSLGPETTREDVGRALDAMRQVLGGAKA
jgi:cysteine desulfurase